MESRGNHAANEASARHGGDNALRTALFLDRDGVINVDIGYPHRPEDLVFTPSAVEAVLLANAVGFLVIVVTNQSGVARGLFGMDAVHDFHDAIQARMAAVGARIDAFYLCPYHPEASVAAFRADHEDRKPKPGMLLRAIDDWRIDAGRSLMVGDKPSDIAAAASAGVAATLVPSNTVDLRAVVETWLEEQAHRCAA